MGFACFQVNSFFANKIKDRDIFGFGLELVDVEKICKVVLK